MTSIGYAAIPVPPGGVGPDVPADLAAMATALDPHLVQTVTDSAARDTLLSGAPQHTVAVAADGTTWIKTSDTDNTWVTVWQPVPSWQTLPVATGCEAGQTTPQVRIVGQQVFLRGRVAKIDGTLMNGAPGFKLASMVTDAIPSQLASYPGGASITGDAMTGVCRIEIYSPSDSSGGFGVGDVIFYSQDGIQDSGTVGMAWVDISGSYWLD